MNGRRAKQLRRDVYGELAYRWKDPAVNETRPRRLRRIYRQVKKLEGRWKGNPAAFRAILDRLGEARHAREVRTPTPSGLRPPL